jgi:hypothetical protein
VQHAVERFGLDQNAYDFSEAAQIIRHSPQYTAAASTEDNELEELRQLHLEYTAEQTWAATCREPSSVQDIVWVYLKRNMDMWVASPEPDYSRIKFTSFQTFDALVRFSPVGFLPARAHADVSFPCVHRLASSPLLLGMIAGRMCCKLSGTPPEEMKSRSGGRTTSRFFERVGVCTESLLTQSWRINPSS